MLKSVDLYVYCFQKWVHMDDVNMNFDETIYMTFLIKNDEFLKQYNETWDKVSNTIKKGFDSEPVYNEKYLRTKIKFYKGKKHKF